MLYYALVYPYMEYRILVWGSTYPSNLKGIVILQKRVIRIANKAAYDAFGILPFRKIYFFVS
jgi:hypothetical protein